MKKNKTLAFMLAASLLVGGTFVGTKALFTDKIDVAGELAISTGDVDIEVVKPTENKWVLDRNGVENSDGTIGVELRHDSKDGADIETYPGDENTPTTGTFANNLKPGDIMYKDLFIENKGTLKAEVTLGSNFGDNRLGVLEGLVYPSQVVIVDTNRDGQFDEKDKHFNSLENVDFTLYPGQQAMITLELNVKLDGQDYHNTATGVNQAENRKSFNTDDIEDTVINLNNAWTLDAVQQNPGHIAH